MRDTPMKDQAPASLHDKVAYARLTSGSIEISATDWQHQRRTPRQGNTVGLYLNGGSYRELKEAFDKLAVGADPNLLDELRDLPFGSYGHLADRYGVHWFSAAKRLPRRRKCPLPIALARKRNTRLCSAQKTSELQGELRHGG